MRTHTSQFKNELKNMGRQIDSIITYGNTTLHDELYAVTPHFEASLLKSVMKQLDIESSVIIPIGTTVNYQLGVKVGNAYEYMNYGNYVVYSIEKIEDTDTYKMICYDKMLYSMKEYESLGVTYPINIRNFINALCTKVGLAFKDTATQFANYDKIIENELYLDVDGNSLGYTYRDVFDELAQVTASIICIDTVTDKVQIKYPNQTNDTINEEFLKDVNVKFGEKYGPVNTIVLSRSAGADNVYYPDPLPQNPCEIKITDNQIMNWNDRDIYLPDIYNKLNGLEYYINDFSSTGILYYELGDFYNVSVGSTTYKCLMLNNEINVTQGIEELIHTEILEEAQTDYTKADKTDRRINQTYLIVDKQNQKIEAVINTTKEIEHQFETLQDIDGFAEGKYIYLDDASDELITSAKFNGETSQATRSGKNIIPMSSFDTMGNNGTGFTYDASNHRITYSNENNSGKGVYHFFDNFVVGTTYTLSFDIRGTAGKVVKIGWNKNTQDYTLKASYERVSYPFTVPTTKEAIVFYTAALSSGGLTTNEYMEFDNVMITTDGSTDYEQYGVMPSPDYPSEIENLEGKNLLKSIDSSQTINGITFTLNEDKSIIVNGTATANALITVYGEWNGTTIYQKLNPDKYYTISGSTNSNIQIFTRITNGSTISSHTPQTNPTFTGQTGIVNYFIQVLSGAVCDNITIKPQLEEGSKASSYVPYNNLEVKTGNKNIFDDNNVNVLNAYLSGGKIITSSSNDRTIYISCKPNTTYTLSKMVQQTTANNRLALAYTNNLPTLGSSFTERVFLPNGTTETNLSITTDNNAKYLLAYVYYQDSNTSFEDMIKSIQIEEGTEVTDYEEHQEQIVYFPLAEGQKLYEGSYLADDGIHNVKGQVVLDGTENWVKNNNVFQISGVVFPSNVALRTATTKAYCNMYKYAYYSSNITTSMQNNEFSWSGAKIFTIRDDNYGSSADFKTHLVELYANGTPLIVEYELAEEEIIPYNTEQQAAWNSIRELHTYKNITNIFSDAYAEIGYIKDNMLSAFETKASAQLTKNDVSQLKIENGRISSEVSSTQSQLNNYYTKNEADNNTNSTKAELQNIIQQNKTEIEQTTQALNLRVSSIETNGVDKIETSMGYTFNNEGLNIDKEGAATASTIDNEAFKVKNKSANENVFFAGYVSDQDSAYRGQTIVESTNLVVKNYLNIEGASRFQPYVNPVLGGHGTGAFDIG